MREIKFRCYDKQTGQMRHTFEGWSENTDVLSDVFNIINDYGYEIMQFTGLTDKNGVEIYESDIVEFKSGIRTFVEYCNSGFVINSNNTSLHGNRNYITVIGNIHPTPELLTPKQ